MLASVYRFANKADWPDESVTGEQFPSPYHSSNYITSKWGIVLCSILVSLLLLLS